MRTSDLWLACGFILGEYHLCGLVLAGMFKLPRLGAASALVGALAVLAMGVAIVNARQVRLRYTRPVPPALPYSVDNL